MYSVTLLLYNLCYWCEKLCQQLSLLRTNYGSSCSSTLWPRVCLLPPKIYLSNCWFLFIFYLEIFWCYSGLHCCVQVFFFTTLYNCRWYCHVQLYTLLLNTWAWLFSLSLWNVLYDTLCVWVYRPDLVDWRQVERRQVRERIDLAFHVMDREYGVTRLLDPEGECTVRYSTSAYEPLKG